jgi:hypothetical protein
MSVLLHFLSGLTSIRYFGSIDDLLWLSDHGPRDRNVAAEAMTHPPLTSADDLIDAPTTEPPGAAPPGTEEARLRGLIVVPLRRLAS